MDLLILIVMAVLLMFLEQDSLDLAIRTIEMDIG